MLDKHVSRTICTDTLRKRSGSPTTHFEEHAVAQLLLVPENQQPTLPMYTKAGFLQIVEADFAPLSGPRDYVFLS